MKTQGSEVNSFRNRDRKPPENLVTSSFPFSFCCGHCIFPPCCKMGCIDGKGRAEQDMANKLRAILLNCVMDCQVLCADERRAAGL